jgi:predicted RNase H-like HicB family nuclease
MTKGEWEKSSLFLIQFLCFSFSTPGCIWYWKVKYFRRYNMKAQMTLIYWRGEKFWLGKLLEHPEIMTQGKTLKELEENIKDAYHMMVMEDVPQEYEVKKIAI